MLKVINTAAFALTIGLGAICAGAAMAQTGNGGQSGGNGTGDTGVERSAPALTHVPRRQHRNRYQQQTDCGPVEAVDKAVDLGIRRIRIDNTGKNWIMVSGRNKGNYVIVRFAREPGCPVIRRSW